MKTHTTPTGIELLMPQVPRYADDISLGDLNHEDKYFILYYYLHGGKYIDLPYSPKKDWNDYPLLGTCWYEGDHIFIHNGFDPAELGFADFEFQKWLRSEGITIDEGFKRVIIKVN